MHVEDENVNLFPDDDDGMHTKFYILVTLLPSVASQLVNEEEVIWYQLELGK